MLQPPHEPALLLRLPGFRPDAKEVAEVDIDDDDDIAVVSSCGATSSLDTSTATATVGVGASDLIGYQY